MTKNQFFASSQDYPIMKWKFYNREKPKYIPLDKYLFLIVNKCVDDLSKQDKEGFIVYFQVNYNGELIQHESKKEIDIRKLISEKDLIMWCEIPSNGLFTIEI